VSRRHLGLSDQAREASNLLAAVYGWFTEVFETLGLKDARFEGGEGTARRVGVITVY
jgi:hypothetical protein